MQQDSQAHMKKAFFFFFCVNLIIQIFIYMVRKTSSSFPRHHEAPPDSHDCAGGRDSRLPHIHPGKQGVRGQAERTFSLHL